MKYYLEFNIPYRESMEIMVNSFLTLQGYNPSFQINEDMLFGCLEVDKCLDEETLRILNDSPIFRLIQLED